MVDLTWLSKLANEMLTAENIDLQTKAHIELAKSAALMNNMDEFEKLRATVHSLLDQKLDSIATTGTIQRYLLNNPGLGGSF